MPSAYLALPRQERAFITAAIQLRTENEEKKRKELERKQRH
ncbi:MAG: hypothetical protein ACLUNZ_13860 [Evtepia sp.]